MLGSAGYWLMTVTALFATAGATNSGLYPATGLAERDGRRRAVPARHEPPGRRARARWASSSPPLAAIILAVFFDLNAIASIGSAVALVVFTLVTFGHFRIRHETGAQDVAARSWPSSRPSSSWSRSPPRPWWTSRGPPSRWSRSCSLGVVLDLWWKSRRDRLAEPASSLMRTRPLAAHGLSGGGVRLTHVGQRGCWDQRPVVKSGWEGPSPLADFIRLG